MEQQKHNPKVEWGFYATTPRIVRTHYKNITLVEKWLYVCLKDLCGDTGTCYRTLRVLASETDLALGTLSTGIRHLHDAGLIHAEKKRRSMNPTAKEVWHITIVDIWQENAKVHPTAQRSPDEQKRSGDEHYTENVQEMNNNVHVANNDASERSGDEQQCSNFDDRSNNIEERTITEERTMEGEREGEQEENATIAPSLSLGAALPDFPLITYADCITYLKLRGVSPQGDAVQVMVQARMLKAAPSQSDNETQSQSFPRANSNTPLEGGRDALVDSHSLPDANLARSALDCGWQAVGEVSDGKEQEIARICDTCGRPQTQADCPWCMTTRLPAIPKPPPGGTSHEQNRDALPPRSVAVEVDSGCTAPQVPPGVTPPRTMRATVVSPDLPTVKPKPARRKKGELDEVTQKRVESVIAYLDALKQEVMEDPETHYKPSLTDIESVVKTLLPQNPTEKRVRLVFFDMWNETDRDGNHFWRKHMQIHNVCKQYEGRIMGLEGKDKQDGRGNAQAPISSLPTSRGQQWRSSFDDPDYDMSAEFYPGTVAR